MTRHFAIRAVLLAALLNSRRADAQTRSEKAIQQSVGLSSELTLYRNDEQQERTPLNWTLGIGHPRHTQLEIEPAYGWKIANGSVVASGLSFTRVRAYHLFQVNRRFSIGPDVEAYLKTESDTSLGWGENRVMPGIQAAWQADNGWRATVRMRYEFSGGEDPGIKALGQLRIRPAIFSPIIGRVSFWGRFDVSFDMHGAPTQYNVEGLAAVRIGAHRRFSAFFEPRLYVGPAARAHRLWRIRAGLTWSLADLVLRHAGGD